MRVLNRLPDHITRILTDSRRVMSSAIESGDTAFVALKTGVGDGHRYVKSLYEKGLRTFIVNDIEDYPDLTDATFVVSTDNTLDFLIKNAGERLSRSNVRQIIVTGSVKKTTTKELLTQAMRRRGIKVTRSPRTWNSAMGATLSVFESLRHDADVMIIEIGIDAPGQAERLRPILRPSIGVLTTMTEEHDEYFASHKAKIREKLSLLEGCEELIYVRNDSDVESVISEMGFRNAQGVDDYRQAVEKIAGVECAPTNVSTRIDVRKIPEDGVLFIDSFTNDLDSLPLSLDLASQRQAGRGLTVILSGFEGDRRGAVSLIEERGGKVFFIDGNEQDFINSHSRREFERQLILIKGEAGKIINYFDEARHDTMLQVDLDGLVHNFNVYRRILPPGTGIVGMVKADAYGLGALEVAKTLQSFGASYLAVAVIDEGVELRQSGVTMPIIVLNPITNRFDALVRYNLEASVFSIEELERIEEGVSPHTDSPVNVHLKIDTGMHRVGFTEDEFPAMIARLKTSNKLRPVSVFSHLATADCPALKTNTDTQLQRFDGMVRFLEDELGTRLKRHILNTAGTEEYGTRRPDDDYARIGIGLYGFSPASEMIQSQLRPVARLVSTVISMKRWPAGTTIGYGCKGVVSRESVIATVPIGYADGIDRRLGNGRISFAVEGVKCPTIGNICMDLLMIDVTDAINSGKDVRVGSEVEIFGSEVKVEDIATTLETIPYEILTSVSPRVRRTYHYR